MAAVQTDATKRIVLRLILYYTIVIGLVTLAWGIMPREGWTTPTSLDALFGGGPVVASKKSSVPFDEFTLAITAGIAMVASVLLALPVAWVYLLTRSKRGYQQSVVQLLIIMPLVVSGIVILVKYSPALAFSLAGIVAAVRFRNTLDDSKDAVYVFLATGIGLAAAVNLPVALVISIAFNATAIVLWYIDFGVSPVELDGRIAERRLRRAKQLAKTGTFVAHMDEEVFRNMTREQLEGVADRAWRRAHEKANTGEFSAEARLRILTADLESMRTKIEPKLQDYTKTWRMGSVSQENGHEMVEYFVQLKKKTPGDELISLLRAAGQPSVLDAKLDQ